MSLKTGSTLGHYEIVSSLGAGGMVGSERSLRRSLNETLDLFLEGAPTWEPT